MPDQPLGTATSPLPPSPRRSVLLAAWGTAWLQGRVGLDDVVAAVSGDDLPHVVVRPEETSAVDAPWADDAGPAPFAWSLGRLRGAGARGLRAVLPVPGDVLGVPGPGQFSEAALSVGEGVVVVGTPLGLVPRVERHGTALEGVTVSVRWEQHGVPLDRHGPLGGLPQVSEAEQELGSAVRQTTSTLLALDVARWRPDVAGALRSLRDGDGTQRGAAALPPGHPQRAVRLYAMAERLATVVELAGQDEGGAVAAGEVRCRQDALTGLARAVHRARLAAANAALELPDAASRLRRG